jgi:anti-sigma B factor antagonist
MEFTEETVEQVKIFHLKGKIMGGPETKVMCNYLKNFIDAGTQSLVINFREVPWVNSNGVGAIIACLTTLRRRGGDVRFANLHGAARQYFHITRLETVIQIFDSVDEAVGSFTSER